MAKLQFWYKVLLLVGSLLLAQVAGGRLSELARRKGYSKHTIRDLNALQERAAGSGSRRYYNNDTASQSRHMIPFSPTHVEHANNETV